MDETEFYHGIRKFWETRNNMPNFYWENLQDLNEALVLKYLKPGYAVLDVGCGTGELIRRIAPLTSYIEGVDYVHAFKHSIPNANFICSDLREYVPQRKFDLMILFGVTQYLCDKDVVLLYRKLKNCLKNGGKLLLKHQVSKLETNKEVNGYSEKLYSKYMSIFRTILNDKKLLEESGFEVDNIVNPYPDNLNKWTDSCYKLYDCRKHYRVEMAHQFSSSQAEMEKFNEKWTQTHNIVLAKKTLDKEESIKLLLNIYDHLKQYNVRPLISYGTLLGIVRQQDLISYDTDVDFIIREQDSENLPQALLSLPKPFELLRIARNPKGGDICISIGNDKCYCDIYVYLEAPNNKYSYIWYDGTPLEEKFNIEKVDLDNTSTIKFLNKEFLTLDNYHKYLEKWYGDWRVPVNKMPERF